MTQNTRPRGGVIGWQGPSPTGRFSPRRSDGKSLLRIEKVVGDCLAAFLSTHSCIGARELGASHGFFFSVYPDMTSVESAALMIQDLDTYFQQTDVGEQIVKSLICVFTEPCFSEKEFADKFWAFAQVLHDVDSLTHDWDQSVSSDTENPAFELSLRGRAIFPATLHNNHSRPMRRFMYPAWAMNQSSQFEALRRTGDFDDWQRKIRKADSRIDPSGAPNPLLADHGTASAAAQLGQMALVSYPLQCRSARDRSQTATRLLRTAILEGAPPPLLAHLREVAETSVDGSDLA
jgi:FPC/CPF motif-containing protein YcgG